MAVDLAPLDIPLMLPMSGFSPAQVQAVVVKMTHLARSNLVTRAQKQLRTSARDYVAAIAPVEIIEDDGGSTGFVDLVGAFANMVENGAQPWDLRDSLLKPGTRNLRISAKGFLYLSVPFGHAMPGASGRNHAVVGSAYTGEGQSPKTRAHRGDLSADDAAKMGRAVARAARQLAPSTGLPGGKVSYGGRLDEGTGGAGLLRPRHATDIYAGMIRNTKFYEKATQSTHTTFRTISNNPDTIREDEGGPNWLHPGITARQLVPQTANYIGTLLLAGAFK